MPKKMKITDEVLSELNADEVLHGIGLELMMMVEDADAYGYNSIVMDTATYRDRLWVLCLALGAVVMGHQPELDKIVVKLPNDIGARRVRNPYYQGKSSDTATDSEVSLADLGDDFPF